VGAFCPEVFASTRSTSFFPSGRILAWGTNWISDADRRSNRILYSLDLFVPPVSRYMEKARRPSADCWRARYWWVVQKCLGWVIGTIGVSAFTDSAKL
jgi:hypothetical protein